MSRTAVGAPSSLAYCRLAVKSQASDKAAWNPRAVAVLRREVGAWEPLDETVAPRPLPPTGAEK